MASCFLCFSKPKWVKFKRFYGFRKVIKIVFPNFVDFCLIMDVLYFLFNLFFPRPIHMPSAMKAMVWFWRNWYPCFIKTSVHSIDSRKKPLNWPIFKSLHLARASTQHVISFTLMCLDVSVLSSKMSLMKTSVSIDLHGWSLFILTKKMKLMMIFILALN